MSHFGVDRDGGRYCNFELFLEQVDLQARSRNKLVVDCLGSRMQIKPKMGTNLTLKKSKHLHPSLKKK